MRQRPLILSAVFAVLGLAYVFLFTDWIRPEPIQIVSQVRASILQPNFKGPSRKIARTNAESGHVDVIRKTNVLDAATQAKRVRLPDWGEIPRAPGGVANVTFSLDTTYSLTSLQVLDVPADGSAPRVVWDLVGKSAPTRSLLYGRIPSGMNPRRPGATSETLAAGVPYVLVLEAGRRRGTNSFRTAPSHIE